MNPDTKRRLVTRFQKYALNPVTRFVAGMFPGWVLLETTGRKSGKKRRTPVGGTREGDTYWIVSEQGTKADYVRNLRAHPNIRIRMNGRWHDATATVMPDDDAQARVAKQSMWNRTAVRSVGTELLTIRIDLRRRPAGRAARA